MNLLYIGIDDTDSKKGMCTTYIGARLADELSKFSEISKLKLVRLNPNIKWKTRGNASVCIGIETKRKEKAKDLVLSAVEKYAELRERNTNPGVVFFEGRVPEEFRKIYYKALHGIVPLKEVEKIAKMHEAEVHKFKAGRGIIGAVAAMGSEFEDHTYEIIAYRKKENCGKERKVDMASVLKMDSLTFPLTFNNFDYQQNRVLITPHSPCPVLFGIRGENKEVLTQASDMIRLGEDIERVALFKTNQGTDAHLERVENINDIKPYSSVILKGKVIEDPKTISGGHVIFSISDRHGNIDCAAYEPTKDFRWVVKELKVGDIVKAYGGVRNNGRLTINLEKLEILRLNNAYKEINPTCKKCGKSMKSAGKGQGFRCKRCKTNSQEKIKVKVERQLEEKLYQVPPSAMRHLSKPLVRGF